jgi:hypothetical protein
MKNKLINKKYLIYRRELCDLNDPIEGPILLRIAGLSLRRDGEEISENVMRIYEENKNGNKTSDSR